MAVARLNSRLRKCGLSAREIWTQRDQFSNEQIPLDDYNLILQQATRRELNHPHSEKSKTPSGKTFPNIQISVGDLVYLHSDRSKLSHRDRYLVVSTDSDWCLIRKFTKSQLRTVSYKVKRSECYKVASTVQSSEQSFPRHYEYDSASDDEHLDTNNIQPLEEPHIPPELSTPLSSDSFDNGSDTVHTPKDNSIPNTIAPDSTEERYLRRSSRKRQTPRHFSDFVMN